MTGEIGDRDLAGNLQPHLMLLGRPYWVKIVERHNHAEGRIWLWGRRIEIADVESPEYRDGTLLHELIHIAVETMKWEPGEDKLDTLGTLLYALLKDNGFWRNPAWWAAMRTQEAQR